jgi:protein NRD1
MAASEQPRTAQSTTSAPEGEKDEFGRDLRPHVDDPNPTNIQTQQPSESDGAESHQIDGNMQLEPHAPPPTVFNRGLDQFDIEAVDLSSPASWETLREMWQASYGYLPAQEELMQFVLAKRIVADGSLISQSGVEHTWGNSGWPNANRGGAQAWRGRGWSGHPRGRGGHSYSPEQRNQIPAGYSSTSDAVVLHSVPDDTGNQVSSETSQNGASSSEAGQSRTTGKMQRVGDRWIFVREPSGGVS